MVVVPVVIPGTASKQSALEETSYFLRFFFEENSRNIIKQRGRDNQVLEHNKGNCAIKGKWWREREGVAGEWAGTKTLLVISKEAKKKQKGKHKFYACKALIS